MRAHAANERDTDMAMTQQEAARRFADILLEAIAGTTGSSMGGIPDGHLYAAVMGIVNLDVYQATIRALVGAGLVTNRGHFLAATPAGIKRAAADRAREAAQASA